ncbi:hypothetical protein [Thermogutta sp.]|uniref:hypothetical protein n=1 Tax=Thermogutta sp. TaxID=1962930 RepID=UPI0032209245
MHKLFAEQLVHPAELLGFWLKSLTLVMPLAQFSKKRWPTCAAIVFILAVYIPCFLKAGWVCDDWMIIDHWRLHPHWWDTVRSWFPLFSARPLAPIVLSTITSLYCDTPRWYVCSQILLLSVAWGLVWYVWHRLCGEKAAAFFLTAVYLPSIASTLVFSPGMQHLAATAYVLWAASLLCHERAMRRQGPWLLLSGSLIFLGMLIYEIFLPLLILQCLMPIYWTDSSKTDQSAKAMVIECASPIHCVVDLHVWKSVARTTLPILAAVLLGLVVQKFVMPRYFPDMSRLAPGGLSMMLRTFLYWIHAILIQAPILWADGLVRMHEAWDVLALAGALLVIISLVLVKSPTDSARETIHDANTASQSGNKSDRVSPYAETTPAGQGRPQTNPFSAQSCRVRMLRIVCWISTAMSVLLFVLSGSYAAVYGNDNRKLSSLWVAVALAASTFWAQAPAPQSSRRTRWLQVSLCGALLVNATSFLLQRNNYLQSWQAQQMLLTTINQETQRVAVPQGAVLLVAVPPVVPTNHNDECVFTRSWDIASALRIVTHDHVADAVTLYPWLLVQGRLMVDGPRLVVDNLWQTDVSRESVFFIGCELKQCRPAGIKDFLYRSLGTLPPVIVELREPCEPVKNDEELLHVVRLATESLNVHPPMSLPAKVTQRWAEWIRTVLLGKPAVPLHERVFHPTIIEQEHYSSGHKGTTHGR